MGSIKRVHEGSALSTFVFLLIYLFDLFVCLSAMCEMIGGFIIHTYYTHREKKKPIICINLLPYVKLKISSAEFIEVTNKYSFFFLVGHRVQTECTCMVGSGPTIV